MEKPEKGETSPRRTLSFSGNNQRIKGWKFRNVGFSDFLHNNNTTKPRYSDTILICNQKKYFAHRLVLAFSSDYFTRVFAGNFKESKENEIELK